MKVFGYFCDPETKSIKFEEAKKMAKAFNLNYEELTLIFNEIDQNGDGNIEADEWREFIFKTSNKNFVKNKIVDKLKDKEWIANLEKEVLKEAEVADAKDEDEITDKD